MPCLRSPTASAFWSMAASSPPAIRPRSGPILSYVRLISGRAEELMVEARNPPLLELSGIETSYGLSRVLFGLSLTLGNGEMVSLMGRNGMGKTPTVRSIMGLTPAAAGSIRFGGEEIRTLPTYRVAKLGIGLVPEGRQVFPNLTARENLVATATNRAGAANTARDKIWTLERI